MTQLFLPSHSLPADQNPAAVFLAGCNTRNTRRAYERCLENIAQIFGTHLESLDWTAIRHPHAQAIRARLIEVYDAAATINQHLSALRGVLEQAWLLGYMQADEYQRMINALGNITERKLPAGRHISDEEFLALLATCDDNKAQDIRDRAILSVLFVTGMRRSELIGLNIGDFDTEVFSLHIRNTKTKEDRLVYIGGKALAHLQYWVTLRGYDKAYDPLFCTADKRFSRLSESTIYYIIKSRAKAAGLKPLTPHDFRRTFISNGFDNPDVDEATLASITGHRDMNSLKRYDRRGERAKKRAAQVIDIP